MVNETKFYERICTCRGNKLKMYASENETKVYNKFKFKKAG